MAGHGGDERAERERIRCDVVDLSGDEEIRHGAQRTRGQRRRRRTEHTDPSVEHKLKLKYYRGFFPKVFF